MQYRYKIETWQSSVQYLLFNESSFIPFREYVILKTYLINNLFKKVPNYNNYFATDENYFFILITFTINSQYTRFFLLRFSLLNIVTKILLCLVVVIYLHVH